MALELALSGFGWAVTKSLLAKLFSELPLLDELAPELVDWFRELKAQTPTSEEEQLLQLAQNITNRFKADLKATLPEHELLALLYEFDQTFKTFEIKQLFDLQLDAEQLAKHLLSVRPQASQQLSPKASSLYQQLITSAAQELVLLSSALPTFRSLRDASLLQILPALKALIEGPQQEIREFEKDYLNQVCAELNKLELFGVPRLNNIMEQQKLETAYVNLEVEYQSQRGTTSMVSRFIESFNTDTVDKPIIHFPTNQLIEKLNTVKYQSQQGTASMLSRLIEMSTPNTAVKPITRQLFEISNVDSVVEPITHVLSRQRRIIVRGSAGSGKTTLLRWLAIQIASNAMPPQLAYWNTLIPFYIRLRSIEDQSGFPTFEQYVAQIDPDLVEQQPDKWAHHQMKSGRAVLLIDGLDELAKDRRSKFLERLQRLVRTYPLVSYVISSRPAATREDNWEEWFKWSKQAEFLEVNITKMDAQAIERFIDHWHRAYEEGSAVKSAKDLQQAAHDLKRLLPNRSAIHSLAENPLLCSMICALHLERRQNLPNRRLQLYKECIDMMLERDNGREINTDSRLDVEQKRALLQTLALKMIRNKKVRYGIDKVDKLFSEELPKYDQDPQIAADERKNLVERSGLLQEPTEDTIEFTHRTFQEYLAATEIVEQEEEGYLLDQTQNEQLRDLFPLAIGQMRQREAEDFLNNLIVEQAPLSQKLLALSSLETTLKISSKLREQIFNAVGELFPPYRREHQSILASVGEAVIPYLLCERQPNIAAMTACIEVLAQISGEKAFAALETYSDIENKNVQAAIDRAWPYFDAELFARKFLQQRIKLRVSEPHLLPNLQYLPNLQQLALIRITIQDFSLLSGLENLQQLDLIYTQVSDLRVLNGLQNLQQLDLIYTQVSDLRVLNGLQNLQQLRLSWTQVSDLSALSSLQNLQELDLSGTQVNDLSILSGLENLQQLNLIRTQVSDLSGLSSLQNLQQLNLSDTQVSDLSGLSGLQHLVQLNLSDTQVSDLSGLSSLQNLVQLNLSRTQVSDLSRLSGLQNLVQLNLSDTQVSDLSGLSSLQNLVQLNLSGTQVNDVSMLSSLQNLVQLNLSGTQVKDLSALSSLQNLQQLDLSDTQVSDWSALSSLQNLQQLDLSKTQVSDLSALSSLQNLQQLDLGMTRVSDLSVLSGLHNLQELHLRAAQVSDLSVLSGLQTLQELDLSETQVSDLSALSTLKDLEYFNIHGTLVQDLSPLRDLPKLKRVWID